MVYVIVYYKVIVNIKKNLIYNYVPVPISPTTNTLYKYSLIVSVF